MVALVVTAVLLVVNGFFVALEFGLVGSRRPRLEAMAEEGNRRAQGALAAIGDLNIQLSGAQLGITMASLGIGALAEPALAGLLEGVLGADGLGLPSGLSHTVAFVIALAIVVFLHMVIGEMVPKNLTLVDPERTLLRTAGPSRAYLLVFRPVVWVLTKLSNGVVRLLGAEPRDELTTAHTADELALMVAESHEEGFIESFAHDLLTGVLDFGGAVASGVMVPAADIVTVDRSTPVAEVERVIVASGHSRICVTDVADDVDTVIGFVHAKDLLMLPVDARDEPLPLRLVRRMLVVPVDRSLEDLLLAMRSTRLHLALVRAESGATAGIVSLEDLLEELVGDILDESDRSGRPLPPRPVEAGTVEAAPARRRRFGVGRR